MISLGEVERIANRLGIRQKEALVFLYEQPGMKFQGITHLSSLIDPGGNKAYGDTVIRRLAARELVRIRRPRGQREVVVSLTGAGMAVAEHLIYTEEWEGGEIDGSG